MNAPQLSIVIPLYNEQQQLPHCVAACCAFMDQCGIDSELILADDGSGDGTLALAHTHAAADRRIRVISLAHRGKGSAVMAGARLARARDWILLTDCDLSTPLSEFPRLQAVLDDADIAIGSRAVPESQIHRPQPRLRQWLGRAGNTAIRAWLGVPWRDTQCGFKLLRRRALPALLACRDLGIGYDFEMLVGAHQRGLRVCEVGVQWRHHPHSQIRWHHYVRALATLVRMRRRSYQLMP